jgi:hypothetical protein
MLQMSFNCPILVGKELDYMRQVIVNWPISGDGHVHEEVPKPAGRGTRCRKDTVHDLLYARRWRWQQRMFALPNMRGRK